MPYISLGILQAFLVGGAVLSGSTVDLFQIKGTLDQAYDLPAFHFDLHLCRTNRPPHTAVRGPGEIQVITPLTCFERQDNRPIMTFRQMPPCTFGQSSGKYVGNCMHLLASSALFLRAAKQMLPSQSMALDLKIAHVLMLASQTHMHTVANPCLGIANFPVRSLF